MANRRGLRIHDTGQAGQITGRLESRPNRLIGPLLWLAEHVVSREAGPRETPERVLAPSPETIRRLRPAGDLPSTRGPGATQPPSRNPEPLAGLEQGNDHRAGSGDTAAATAPEMIADIVYRMMRRDIVLDRERRP